MSKTCRLVSIQVLTTASPYFNIMEGLAHQYHNIDIISVRLELKPFKQSSIGTLVMIQ